LAKLLKFNYKYICKRIKKCFVLLVGPTLAASQLGFTTYCRKGAKPSKLEKIKTAFNIHKIKSNRADYSGNNL